MLDLKGCVQSESHVIPEKKAQAKVLVVTGFALGIKDVVWNQNRESIFMELKYGFSMSQKTCQVGFFLNLAYLSGMK